MSSAAPTASQTAGKSTPQKLDLQLIFSWLLADGIVAGDGFLLFLVPLFFGHHDRQGDVVGIFADDGFELPRRQEFVFAFAQVQDDVGAAVRLVDRFDGKVARAFGFPAHAFVGGRAGAAGFHRDAVGDDEAGVEADAELADQRRILLLVAGEFREEFLGAGFGDGAEMLDRLVARHADAVVADRDRALFLVEADLDLQVGIVLEQRAVVDRLEAQLVGGVGRIRDQLAQENFLVRVQGVDHQLQQLFYFRLEAKGLFFG